MPKIAPTTAFSTWAIDATSGEITINISDFVGVSAAELHATTGDIGVFIRAFNDKLASFYAALATADRPARWSVVKGTASAVAITGAVSPQRIPYTTNVDVAAPAAQYEIVPE